MIKYCRFGILLMFLAMNLNPISLISLEEQTSAKQRMEEEIPLPPSLRGYQKQELPREDNFMKEFVKMLMTLGAIITVLLVVSFLIKRFTNTRIQQINESSDIKILERRAITAKTSIYLLDIKGKQIAIVESHNGLLLLPEVPNNADL